MKLTNQQIISLAEAITHLDGQHVMQVVEGRAVSIFKSYRLAHAARWLLARAQGCLGAAIADFNRAKDALINHYSSGTGQLAPHHADFSKFVADFEKLKQEMVELPLQQITLDQLHLDDNEKTGQEMPIAVLNALRPIIAEATDDKISASQTSPDASTK